MNIRYDSIADTLYLDFEPGTDTVALPESITDSIKLDFKAGEAPPSLKGIDVLKASEFLDKLNGIVYAKSKSNNPVPFHKRLSRHDLTSVPSLPLIRLRRDRNENNPDHKDYRPSHLLLGRQYLVLAEMETTEHYILFDTKTGKPLSGIYELWRFERVPREEMD